MYTKTKNYYASLLLDLLKTLLISFVIYFASATLLAAILEEEKNVIVIRAVVSAAFFVIYYFSFYLMHARKDAEDYALNMPDGEYSFKSDTSDIIKRQGKKLAIVYGLIAVVFEICGYFPTPNPLRAFLLPMFPITYLINIPVLSSVLGWAAVCAISIFAITNGHRKVHINKKKGRL